MEDSEILQYIEKLVQEEHVLIQQLQQGGLDTQAHQRMHQLTVSLDQCWD
ncbi:MAG: DUF2630 family protein, partial [Ktedonobacteraceae bacterium]